MKTTRLKLGLAAAALAAILAACAAQMGSGGSVNVGANDLGGVVTGAQGPEAGVWVIAETKDLPTPYAKIVVTDQRLTGLNPGDGCWARRGGRRALTYRAPFL